MSKDLDRMLKFVSVTEARIWSHWPIQMRFPLISPRAQKLLWLWLLWLTIVLVLWPVVPSPYDPLPVQSIYAIRNLPWFAVLFLTWAASLAVLLFGGKGRSPERLLLCMIFSLVFVESWTFVSPWGTHSDSTWLTAHVRYLGQTNHIPPGDIPALRYFDYPALSLLGVGLMNTTGLGIFKTIQVFLLTNGLVFVLVLYTAFLKFLGTPYRAAVGTVLAMSSDQVLAVVPNYFHPITLASTYTAIFLLLTGRAIGRQDLRASDQVLLILLVVAATTEYLFTPVLFGAVVLSVFIVQVITRIRGFATFGLFALITILFFIWVMYSLFTFRTLLSSIPSIISNFRDGTWLLYLSEELRAQGGGSYPWWGTISRFFWWVLVIGGGSILAFARAFHLQTSDDAEKLQFGWLLGLSATVVIGAVGTPDLVHGGLSRYIWIAPLFLVPVLVDALSRPSLKMNATAFALASLLMLLPTFLSNADTVSRDTTYLHELKAGQFANSVYGDGRTLVLYLLGPGAAHILSLYSPLARWIPPPEGRGITTEDVWFSMRSQLRGFFGVFDSGTRAGTPIPGYTGRGVVLFASFKERVSYQEKVGVEPHDPNWSEIEKELSHAFRFYDNGFDQMYRPPTNGHLVSFKSGL